MKFVTSSRVTERRKLKQTIGKLRRWFLKRFLKWKKVFWKVESERMPTRKIWDHAIDLKETFKLQKRRILLQTLFGP